MYDHNIIFLSAFQQQKLWVQDLQMNIPNVKTVKFQTRKHCMLWRVCHDQYIYFHTYQSLWWQTYCGNEYSWGFAHKSKTTWKSKLFLPSSAARTEGKSFVQDGLNYAFLVKKYFWMKLATWRCNFRFTAWLTIQSNKKMFVLKCT